MDKNAVVCDDDRTMSGIVGRLLGKAGFNVFTAENGDDGLSLIRAQSPKLLVLDLDMPVKDGWSVLRELKGGTQKPYIIVLSAQESADSREMAITLGADEALVKPFNPAQFLKKIETLVKERKL